MNRNEILVMERIFILFTIKFKIVYLPLKVIKSIRDILRVIQVSHDLFCFLLTLILILSLWEEKIMFWFKD